MVAATADGINIRRKKENICGEELFSYSQDYIRKFKYEKWQRV